MESISHWTHIVMTLDPEKEFETNLAQFRDIARDFGSFALQCSAIIIFDRIDDKIARFNRVFFTSVEYEDKCEFVHLFFEDMADVALLTLRSNNRFRDVETAGKYFEYCADVGVTA